MRTVGSSVRFCFNCRRVCEGTPGSIPTLQVFNEAELRRLNVYRMAILAGLYSDFAEVV
jgi:hypothetical protein